MKKKIFLIISMCLMLLGLTACTKTDPTTVDYNGYSYDDLKSACQNTYSTLISLSDDDKQSYLDSGTQITIDLINSWDSTKEIAGDFVEFTDCDVTISGKTLTVEQGAKCTNRDIKMTYVYNYKSMEETGINVEPVYSMGETMSKAGLNTFMGIAIVFVMLIMISFIIKGFEVIHNVEAKSKKAAAVETKTASVPVVEAPQVEETDDLELVAVIAAAIAAATGTTTDDFVVRSIKRR